MRAMLRTSSTALLNHVVRGFARWWPREQPPPAAAPPRWQDTGHGEGHISLKLSAGVEAIEPLEAPPVFPDTMPAFHFPPAAPAVMR
jgi:hypothetical protein